MIFPIKSKHFRQNRSIMFRFESREKLSMISKLMSNQLITGDSLGVNIIMALISLRFGAIL